MKRILMTVLFLYVAGRTCQGQEKNCMAGIELTSFLHGSTTVSICYGFSRHWSAAIEGSISYDSLLREKSETELEHSGEFSHGVIRDLDQDQHAERAIFSWWPSQVMQGFSLSAGIQSGLHSGCDILIETGYTVNIWKGLCISAGIRIPLLKGTVRGIINAHNIRTCIQYRF